MLKGWRIAIAKLGPKGEIISLESAYTKEAKPFPRVGKTLEDKRGFHVGTSRDFCLDYYQGMKDLEPGEAEILIELEIEPDHLQDPSMVERWQWPCPTEAIVTKALITNTEILAENPRP